MIKTTNPRKPLKRKKLPNSTGRLKTTPKTRGIVRKGGRRRKKGEITKLKAILWQLCRQIQIKKYGNTCYSCGTPNLTGSGLHLGHFITSSICSTELRYSLDNLRPQCYRCNIHLSGNWPSFEAHLLKDGIDIAELKRRNEETKGKTYSKEYFLDKIEEYRAQITN